MASSLLFLKIVGQVLLACEGGTSSCVLSGPLILFEFEVPFEVERILRERRGWYMGKKIWLFEWSPEVGCLKEEEQTDEVWVRILGLPFFCGMVTFLSRLGMPVVGL